MEKIFVEIYDTTLRDGAQQAGISFSLHDKLVIVGRLDKLGVHFIELGWPGANEKDDQVFRSVKKNPPKNAKITAFGMTCAKGKKPENDHQLQKLLAAETEVVTIVGKASRLQVERVLGITPEENLRLINESCRFLADHGRTVFFDAEHFFDGYKLDHSFAMSCIQAAYDGGAEKIILCDTNGGSLPCEISIVVRAVKKTTVFPLGIHTHNDGEMAVANSLSAIDEGATQVQGTINGYGERCGNANLCSVIPALVYKMHMKCILPDAVAELTDLARFTAELSNLPLDPFKPYVGRRAFCHKGGLHVNAISKDPASYHHINPEVVGNTSSVAVSELSGRSNVVMKAKEFGIILTPAQVKNVLAQVESLENTGFQFEGADGSLKLLMLRQMDGYSQPFNVLSRDVKSTRHGQKNPVDSATVKVYINNNHNETAHHVADGDGPIDALSKALLKSLLIYFPNLKKTTLVDYKVRVLPGKKGTAKAVRILIDFSDGHEEWTTVGCSTDSIEASLLALTDGFEYAILKAQ